ncbi:hypothetical protein IAT38_003370 [Cryptococcus sp. DSM 104549]
MFKEPEQGWEKILKWLKDTYPGFETSILLEDSPGALRGMITSDTIKPRATLLHIPSSAMLNPLTLLAASSSVTASTHPDRHSIPRHLFPQPTHVTSSVNSSKRLKPSPSSPTNGVTATPAFPRQLDTTELLTLQVALSRDPQKRYESDWQVYIETLPKDFRPWHPATWVIKPEDASKQDDWEWWHSLYEIGTSPTLKAKIQDVKKRFETDYGVLMEVLRKEEPFKSHNMASVLTQEDFLWAWLNVNTRSISIPLGLPGPSERMNHTLVPILDFINHSSNPNFVAPRVRQLPTPSPAARPGPGPTTRRTHKVSTSEDWAGHGTGYSRNGVHLVPGKIDLRLIAPERGMELGEEVRFEYGGHNDAMLFAEYGFCETPEGEGEEKWLTLKYGELDLGWMVDELWKEKVGEKDEEDDEEEEKQKVLEAIGCWGSNIVHAQPSPVHPSHSLLMTLRVLHLPANSTKLSSIQQGFSTYISPANELAAISTLEDMLKRVVKGAEKRIKTLKKAVKELGTVTKGEGDAVKEKRGVLEMLEGMCIEDKVLAKALLARIEAGEDFS